MRLSRKIPPFGKTLALITAIMLLITMPEDILHFLAVATHTVYEGIAYAIEELLTHGLCLTKFQAQMVVFYGSCAIGLALVYLVHRRLPTILASAKRRLEVQWQQLQTELLLRWESQPWPRKVQVLLIQFASLVGGLMYLLA